MSSVSAAFPPDFTTAMHELLGPEAQAFFKAQNQLAPVSLRLNPQKLSSPPLSSHQFQSVPWCSEGFYLKERPVFTLDPRFHSGAYYVQDASCMLLSAVLAQLPQWQQADRVLDLCAAPGGKSTLLKSQLPQQACLVSNEVVPARAKVLKENLTKWGCDRVFISQNQPIDFRALTHSFDVIVVDAPCSGEGLFRRQPDAIAEWSAAQVTFCAHRQETIIQDIWPCLAESGLLIYSTCTWNTQENEQLLDALSAHLRFEVTPLSFPEGWGVHEHHGIYRCLPHRMQGEGFSICVLKKIEATHGQATRPTAREKKKQRHRQKKAQPFALPQEIKQWFTVPSKYVTQDLISQGNSIVYWPASQQDFLQDLHAHLREVQGAMPLATLKGRQWVPELTWLLSDVFSPNPSVFAEHPLSLEMALRYLYGEALPAHHHTGQQQSSWQWCSFAGIPLGWVKQTPSHFNNYWPKSWKIRQRFLTVDAETNLQLCLPVEAVRPSDRL